MLQRPRTIRHIVAGMLLATTVFIAAPSAPAKPRCTVKGTSGDDHLIDTAGASRICALGGDDIVEAGPGNDVVLGGTRNDHLEGTRGRMW
jgi:Ca2+-binding RTX toxin-like protein